MPFERTLLQRIDHPEDESLRRVEVDESKLLQSVLDHVQNMFNTRHGSLLTLPDYGLPDFNDLVSEFPDAIVEIRKAIQNSLRKYEPRLEHIQVRHIPDEENPLSLQFEITGRLRTGKKRKGVQFTTIMGESGRIRVWC